MWNVVPESLYPVFVHWNWTVVWTGKRSGLSNMCPCVGSLRVSQPGETEERDNWMSCWTCLWNGFVRTQIFVAQKISVTKTMRMFQLINSGMMCILRQSTKCKYSGNSIHGHLTRMVTHKMCGIIVKKTHWIRHLPLHRAPSGIHTLPTEQVRVLDPTKSYPGLHMTVTVAPKDVSLPSMWPFSGTEGESHCTAESAATLGHYTTGNCWVGAIDTILHQPLLMCYNNNNNGRNGIFYVAGYLIEERRRWPVITASPRGQCSQ